MTWPQVTLGELCRIEIGRTPARDNPAYWSGGEHYPWLSISDMNQGRNIVWTKESITARAIHECNCRLVPVGTLLLSFKLSIGKVSFNAVPLYTNEAVAALHLLSDRKVFKPYLYWALQHVDLLKYVDTAAKGKTLNKRKLNEVVVPLPPLPEQQRIAAILDAADALRAKRRAALGKLDALGRAVFLEMFGEPVGNPMQWPIGRIGDLAAQVNYGTSKKAGETGKYPILRMGNINYDGSWDLTDLKYIDLDDWEAERCLARRGDVLFNRTNSKELVGKTAVFREEQPMAFAGYLVRLVTNDRANPEYVAAFMNTPQIKAFLRERSKSIIGMANINASEFQAIRTPIPPVELQNEFASIIEKILEERKRHMQSMQVGERLFLTLQQRAFRGEL